MPYSKNETPEQTKKMERCVSQIINSEYMKKYKDATQRKSHAIAVCKAKIVGMKHAKDTINIKKMSISNIRCELAKLKKSTKLTDEEKNFTRRKLIMSAKTLGVGKFSVEEKPADETKKEEKVNEKNADELTDEEKALSEDEMEKIEKELDIDGVELEDETKEKETTENVEDENKEDSKESKDENKEDVHKEEKSEEPEKSEESVEESEKTEDKSEEKSEEPDAVEENKKDEKEEEEVISEEAKDENEKDSDNDTPAEGETVESEESTEEPVKEVAEEIVETKEELSKEMIVEIRNELSNLYNDLKDKTETIVKLQKEVDDIKSANLSLSDEKVQLSTELSKYIELEKTREKSELEMRLQLLSENYKKIGQDKTVSELSKLNSDTIKELENVVSIALKADDVPVTTPSQAIIEHIDVNKVEEETAKLSKASNKDFFKQLWNRVERDRIAGKVKINV